MIYHSSSAAQYAEMLQPHMPDDVILLPCRSREEAEANIAKADLLFSWRLPADLFPLAHRLRWVQSMGAGVEDLLKAPVPPGVLLTRVEGLFGSRMSEYAFAHMLAHVQRLAWTRMNQTDRRWEPFETGTLVGKRLGVAGAGSIGAEVARKGKAFGMEVWALVRSDRAMPDVDRIFPSSEAAQFTEGVDYLVSSLPFTPESRRLIDPAHMKQGAVLINMGRGATIDETALLAAVGAGRIEAVLDVFSQEPLPTEHPFWSTPGITVTPHISGPSVPSEVAAYFVVNLRRYLAGGPLLGLVDRQRGY